MEFLTDYGLFLAKAVTVVIALGIIIGLIAGASQKGKGVAKGQIEVTKLNDQYEELKHALVDAVLDPEVLKLEHKAEKKRLKAEKSEQKKAAKALEKENKGAEKTEKSEDEAAPVDAKQERKKRLYVLDFDGDIKASATEHLKEEITAVLSVAESTDEVVVRLESGGGMVHSYGLASSQLARIKDAQIPLTVCVDKVAASGGYMMACIADKIISAPFAILGSIGVVAQIPNFHRLLKKHDVDFEMLTAGEYKRTLTMLGENTDKGREKFVEDLEDTHVLFKDFVSENREQVDIAQVATGEVWFGKRALDVNLVDQLQTSDDYLWQSAKEADVFHIGYQLKKSLPEKLGLAAQVGVENACMNIWQKMSQSRFYQ